MSDLRELKSVSFAPRGGESSTNSSHATGGGASGPLTSGLADQFRNESSLQGVGGASFGTLGGSSAPGASTNTTDVLVVDLGADAIRVGWAGEDAPMYTVPNIVLDVHAQIFSSANARNTSRTSEYCVGQAATKFIQSLPTKLDMNEFSRLRPLDKFEVDWAALERVWEHIFKDIRVDPSECPLLVTVPASCTAQYREKLITQLFTQLDVLSVCLANQAVMGLLSSGRTTGLSVDMGESLTHIVPIFEGIPLRHGASYSLLGGAEVTSMLYHLLDQNTRYREKITVDVVKDIKHKVCGVVPHSKLLLPKNAQLLQDLCVQAARQKSSRDYGLVGLNGPAEYELPDGEIIHLDPVCRFLSPEVYFQPWLLESVRAKGGGSNGSSGGYFSQFLNTGEGRRGRRLNRREMSNTPIYQSSSAKDVLKVVQNESKRVGKNAMFSRYGVWAGRRGKNTSFVSHLNPGTTSSSGMSTFGNDRLGSASNQTQTGIRDLQIPFGNVPIHELIAHSISKCDQYVVNFLWKNVVVTGGGSMFAGLPQRLYNELQLLRDEDAKASQMPGGNMLSSKDPTGASGTVRSIHVGGDGSQSMGGWGRGKLNVVNDNRRKDGVWIGASIYGSLPTFNMLTVTQKEMENDSKVVHQKYFG